MAQNVGRSSHARHRVVAPQTVQQDLLGCVDLLLNLLEGCIRQQWMGARQSSQVGARNPKRPSGAHHTSTCVDKGLLDAREKKRRRHH
jgi:hypothetical protein